MMDYHVRFRNLLLKATHNNLPVYYELFRKKGKVPCVSFMEIQNDSIFHGVDSLSNITYRVNIWGKSIEEIQSISVEIDDVLQNNNFTRKSSVEIPEDDGVIHKAITYWGIGHEW